MPTTPRQHDALWLLAILALALAIRIYMPWPFVFAGPHINLLETDAWYHLRVIEHLAHQFPHRLTADPYVGGAFLKVPPLLDYLVAGAAWLLGGGHPSDALITRLAVFTPPLQAAAAIAVIFFLMRAAAGRTAALFAAALAAVLPGHFLDRTVLGYIDHHALEALVSLCVLALTARALLVPTRWWRAGFWLGIALIAMRLSWTSAALIFAVVGTWLVAHVALHAWRRRPIGEVHRVVGLAAALALLFTRALPNLEPFGVYLDTIALGGLTAMAAAIEVGLVGLARTWWTPRHLWLVTAVVVGAGALGLPILLPDAWRAVNGELGRFGFGTSAAGLVPVLEARPLFLYDGYWSLRPAWMFFRVGLLLGAAGLVWGCWRWWRDGRPVDLLLVIWTACLFIATIGINRFGYYLVPAIALVGGRLCADALAAGQRAGGWRRTAVIFAIAGGAFGMNLGAGLEATTRPSGVPNHWLPAFAWMRANTAEPFDDRDYYVADYRHAPLKSPDSTMMTWWDYGYTVMTAGRRVPIANPTGAGAATAARFYTETDEATALAQLDALRARYVVMDELLPLSLDRNGALFGKFQAVAETAGQNPSRFFDVFIAIENGTSRLIYLFHEDYYRTMAFRLGALGGRGTPPNSAHIVSWMEQSVPPLGIAKVITNFETLPSYDAAQERLKALGPGRHAIVGMTPGASPVPLPPITGLTRVYATPTLGSLGEAAVQIFERAPR